MNLNLLPDLALFVQIVDQGSFSAVARQTGATPSAISRSVSRLEQEMGCKLLHRTTRKLRLSDAGKTVYEHALEMLDSARLAMDSAGSAQAVPQGKLTLSVPKAVGRFVIHPLMLEFFSRYPKIDVCLRLEDRVLDFIDDGIDLALRITHTPSPGLHGKPLLSVSHIVCATSGYLAQYGRPRTPQDLREHSCISLGETPADSRWKFRRDGKTETIQTHGRYAANHTAVRLDAVKQNLGIGSLPLFTAREALANGEIVQVLPEWEFISRYSGQLWLLWSGNKHMPARMRAMIDYLSEKMKPTAGSTAIAQRSKITDKPL
ncbi:TPA: LysR family transcriptional regulator [Klebsiella oxytoca]|uniref:LysR family transcriptional regulator n=1 Tax=Klebsiella oxytoca TaxID=571 RepID=UPI00190EA15D|nr:LysR family transcriptional regulator [Klebsiella oxytoca]MCW9638631.1 LysR family transcriptional regulator [Klebsiella oxytoca]